MQTYGLMQPTMNTTPQPAQQPAPQIPGLSPLPELLKQTTSNSWDIYGNAAPFGAPPLGGMDSYGSLYNPSFGLPPSTGPYGGYGTSPTGPYGMTPHSSLGLFAQPSIGFATSTATTSPMLTSVSPLPTADRAADDEYSDASCTACAGICVSQHRNGDYRHR